MRGLTSQLFLSIFRYTTALFASLYHGSSYGYLLLPLSKFLFSGLVSQFDQIYSRLFAYAKSWCLFKGNCLIHTESMRSLEGG
jgi:hypothetical protein